MHVLLLYYLISITLKKIVHSYIHFFYVKLTGVTGEGSMEQDVGNVVKEIVDEVKMKESVDEKRRENVDEKKIERVLDENVKDKVDKGQKQKQQETSGKSETVKNWQFRSMDIREREKEQHMSDCLCTIQGVSCYGIISTLHR